MNGIEEAIIKVYLLQRDSLRERAESMLEQSPDREIHSGDDGLNAK